MYLKKTHHKIIRKWYLLADGIPKSTYYEYLQSNQVLFQYWKYGNWSRSI